MGIDTLTANLNVKICKVFEGRVRENVSCHFPQVQERGNLALLED